MMDGPELIGVTCPFTGRTDYEWPEAPLWAGVVDCGSYRVYYFHEDQVADGEMLSGMTALLGTCDKELLIGLRNWGWLKQVGEWYFLRIPPAVPQLRVPEIGDILQVALRAQEDPIALPTLFDDLTAQLGGLVRFIRAVVASVP